MPYPPMGGVAHTAAAKERLAGVLSSECPTAWLIPALTTTERKPSRSTSAAMKVPRNPGGQQVPGRRVVAQIDALRE